MRSEGLHIKHYVLSPHGTSKHAIASRSALYAYAEVIEKTNVRLARDLRAWAARETASAIQATRASQTDPDESQ